METIQEHIDRIQHKVQHLIKLLHVAQKENQQLKKDNLALQKQSADYELQLRQLQEQNYILKAATNSMSESDKAALEQSINKYVRDIDKCIGLLNE